MTLRNSLGTGTLIAALLSSTAAMADVTPGDVWGIWREYLEKFDYDVSATESESGGTLTVSDLTLTMAIPEENASVKVTMGEFNFVDQGDGTVAVEIPATLPILVETEGDGEAVTARLAYSNTGFSMIVSGVPEDMVFTMAATALDITLTELTVDGETMQDVTVQVGLDAVASTTNWTRGDVMGIDQSFNTGTVDYTVAADIPEEGSFSYSGGTESLSIDSTLAVPSAEEMSIEDMNAALRAGFAVSASATTGAGQSSFSYASEDGQGQGSSTSSGVAFTMVMNEDQLRYGMAASDWTMSVAGTDIPLPIDLSATKAEFDFSIPVTASETPDDFALLINLLGLAPSEMIWGIADPGGVLAHDPADLVIDLSGKANWLFDIMDPAQVENMGGQDLPGELHSIAIEDLRLKAAGAEVSGIGAFTFDMTDLETFDGMPAPDGSLDLKVVGANALIDNLQLMGLLSDEDVQGARMMMALFGRPGEGDDELLSTIEVKKTGEISANGQRLQ